MAVAQADGVAARDHFTRAQHLFAAMQAAPDLARTERLGKARLIDDNLRAVLQGSLTGNLTVALR